jgi:hypothetical protein
MPEITDAQKDEMLRLLDDLIRKWVNDDVHSETAMFKLRDEMAKRGFAKHFAPSRRQSG